ncbi:hypothetical protein VT84_17165 [Gemmata sp. SH-PL17]|uniref:hypothetical protein n=1 Tax=Gemmata sp. SH-PL17 TaxID=1630693 RepID=UPI00078C7B87|nr:hypothetical protein [Gemmata sp. SH-PL17]AMV26132.1 hypothetical protein VT84_17165 [Gemmata sp. SH-PL17]
MPKTKPSPCKRHPSRRDRLVRWAETLDEVLRIGDVIRTAYADGIVSEEAASCALQCLDEVRHALVNNLFPDSEDDL